jgi:hypothetical protein
MVAKRISRRLRHSHYVGVYRLGSSTTARPDYLITAKRAKELLSQELALTVNNATAIQLREGAAQSVAARYEKIGAEFHPTKVIGGLVRSEHKPVVRI